MNNRITRKKRRKKRSSVKNRKKKPQYRPFTNAQIWGDNPNKIINFAKRIEELKNARKERKRRKSLKAASKKRKLNYARKKPQSLRKK